GSFRWFVRPRDGSAYSKVCPVPSFPSTRSANRQALSYKKIGKFREPSVLRRRLSIAWRNGSPQDRGIHGGLVYDSHGYEERRPDGVGADRPGLARVTPICRASSRGPGVKRCLARFFVRSQQTGVRDQESGVRDRPKSETASLIPDP